jgi:hypothetical protein
MGECGNKQKTSQKGMYLCFTGRVADIFKNKLSLIYSGILGSWKFI